MANKTWKFIKEGLQITDRIIEQNGISVCKNCGMDYQELIKDIENLLKEAIKDITEEADYGNTSYKEMQEFYFKRYGLTEL